MLGFKQMQHSQSLAVAGGFGCTGKVGRSTAMLFRCIIPVYLVCVLRCFARMCMSLFIISDGYLSGLLDKENSRCSLGQCRP